MRVGIFSLRLRLNRHKPDFSLFGGAESLTEGRDAFKSSGAKEAKSPSSSQDIGRAPRRTEVTLPNVSDDGVSYPGPPMDPNDFLWLMTEEPHRSRRHAIMKAHPEVCTICISITATATNSQWCSSGNKADGPYTCHKIHCRACRSAANQPCILLPTYSPAVACFPHHCVCHRGYSKS